jgi:putative nucleotidyltransferase with HDIG domain
MLSTAMVSRTLDRHRDEIVWRIVTMGVLEEQRTLAVDVVAEAFLDRVLDAYERGSYLDLLSWVDATCEFHRELPQIGSMLACACRAVVTALEERGDENVRLATDLASLEQSIGGIAFKPRRRQVPDEANAPDDVIRLIHNLLGRLERADSLTSEHSHAVSAWCARIGSRLSLSESEITYVARCGLIHDVGKMTTPRDILGATRSLTVEEWSVMKTHTSAGEEIVAGYKPLRQFASTVRSHHERLDGKGYPDNLAGSQISLATRIVAVADAFNAMIGRRPYRLPMSPLNALDQLREHRGTQFDPIVVEAMIEVVTHADP